MIIERPKSRNYSQSVYDSENESKQNRRMKRKTQRLGQKSNLLAQVVFPFNGKLLKNH